MTPDSTLPNSPALGLDHSSVEDLNLALRHYRRLMIRLPLILVLGFAAAIGLTYLGTALSPPYGVYILGWDLTTWGLLGLLAVLFAELWWEGRQIGQALNSVEMQSAPIASLLGGQALIGARAREHGMKPGPFNGPLQPIRER